VRPLDGVSQRDAHTAFISAVTWHSLWFHRPFRTDDWLLLRQHSQDRILEEAAATGTRDPVHLASMFGPHPNTAQRYVDAVCGRHDLAASGYAREE